jgi:dihydrofolate reductase
MRSLVVTQNVSLDGSIEFLSEWGDPTAPDEELAEVTRDHSARSDALLVGRRTFSDMRGYWPKQTNDATGVTAHLNQVHKYVVSTTLTDPEWQNSTVLGEDWITSVRELKASDGREIVLTGSISLCHPAIEAGLVDEYRLLVYPAVQGGGRRLFPDNRQSLSLRCIETRRFDSGVVLLRYAS